jgi:hypothetical protein
MFVAMRFVYDVENDEEDWRATECLNAFDGSTRAMGDASANVSCETEIHFRVEVIPPGHKKISINGRGETQKTASEALASRPTGLPKR